MGARSRGRDRASRTQAPQWTPASLAGITALYDDSTLTATHVVGEGVWGTGPAYPTVATWTARAGAGAPALSQSTADARPDERGEVFEAKRRRGPYFKVGRWLVAESHTAFDALHDVGGSTIVCAFVARAQEAGTQTLVMTRAESSAGGPGIWLYNDGLLERVGIKLTNASSEIAAITCASGWRRGLNVVIARLDPAAGRVRLSLNGGTETTAVWSASPVSRGTASANLATLGASATTTTNHRFNGEIYTLATFDRCLSAAECAQLFAYYDAQYKPATVANDTTALSPALPAGQKRFFAIGSSETAGYNATGNVGYVSLAQTRSAGKYLAVGPEPNGGANTDALSGWCIHSRDPTPGHAPSSTNAGRLSESLVTSYTPDVIVYAAGINSVRQFSAGNDALSERFYRNHARDVYESIKQMAAWAPSARFVLLGPFSGTPGFDYAFTESIKLLVAGYREVVSALRADGIKVVLRDWSVIITSSSQMSDPVHPNDAGHSIAADDLLIALDLACGF